MLEKTWQRAVDKKATDGARYIRLVDAGGKTIFCVEVLEMHRDLDQAATVAAMVERLNRP